MSGAEGVVCLSRFACPHFFAVVARGRLRRSPLVGVAAGAVGKHGAVQVACQPSHVHVPERAVDPGGHTHLHTHCNTCNNGNARWDVNVTTMVGYLVNDLILNTSQFFIS